MAEVFTSALRKLAFTVTKDYSVSDTRQIPASGVTVTVYKQGATVNGAQTVTDTTQNVSITCFDAGRAVALDTVQRATDVIAGNATPTCSVDSVDTTTSPQYSEIVLDSDSNGAMAFSDNERMVIIDNGPTLYDESSGISPLGAMTTAADGYAECYVRERFVDVKLSGGGITTRMLYNEESGSTHQGARLNVQDFTTPQAAVDACPAGGTVYFPAGQYEIANPLTLTRSIHIQGDGRGNGTTIRGTNAASHLISCTTDGTRYIHISDLKLSGATTATAQNGINLVASSGANRITYPRFERLFIEECGNHGIYLQDVDYPLFLDCFIENNNADGIRVNAAAWVKGIHVYCNNNEKFGVRVLGSLGFWWNGVGCQDNQISGAADTLEPQMYITDSHAVLIEDSDFEEFNKTTSKTALTIQACNGVTIQNNFFYSTTATGTTGIYLHASNDGVYIGPNAFQSVATCIVYGNVAQVTTITKNAFIAPQAFISGTTTGITIPPVADRVGQNITICGAGPGMDEGLMLPAQAAGSLPTSDADNEGCLFYDTTNNVVVASDGGTSWASNFG